MVETYEQNMVDRVTGRILCILNSTNFLGLAG
jgi:hypothetical protein